MEEKEAKPIGLGELLTEAVLLAMLGSGYSLFLQLYHWAAGDRMLPGIPFGQQLYTIIRDALAVIFLFAAWKRKRWGCFGYIALSAAGILAAPLLFQGASRTAIISAAAGVIGTAVAIAVYRSKAGYFDPQPESLETENVVE